MAVETTAPPRPGWGRRVWEFPITRILAFLLLDFLITAALGYGVIGIRRLAHAPRRLDDFSILLGTAVSAVAVLLAFVVMKRWADRQTAEEAGLPVRGVFSETAIGLLIGGGVFSASVGMLSAVRAFAIGGVNAHFLPLFPLALFLCVAVSEEVVFRGYVFQTLERHWGRELPWLAQACFLGWRIWRTVLGPPDRFLSRLRPVS